MIGPENRQSGRNLGWLIVENFDLFFLKTCSKSCYSTSLLPHLNHLSLLLIYCYYFVFRLVYFVLLYLLFWGFCVDLCIVNMMFFLVARQNNFPLRIKKFHSFQLHIYSNYYINSKYIPTSWDESNMEFACFTLCMHRFSVTLLQYKASKIIDGWMDGWMDG